MRKAGMIRNNRSYFYYVTVVLNTDMLLIRVRGKIWLVICIAFFISSGQCVEYDQCINGLLPGRG